MNPTRSIRRPLVTPALRITGLLVAGLVALGTAAPAAFGSLANGGSPHQGTPPLASGVSFGQARTIYADGGGWKP